MYLRPYLHGETWDCLQWRSPVNLHRLATLLRQVHALPLAGAVFDPKSALLRYATSVGSEHAFKIRDRALLLLSEMNVLQDRQCLCHNDLVAANILESSELMLIDWEYAGIGDPWLDLAIVVQHHELAESLVNEFLEAYLQCEVTVVARERLQVACNFYRELLALWLLL